jgi:anthranilate synthase component 1
MTLYRALPGPIDLLALHRRRPDRYPFLLQSVAQHPQSARYDLLFAFPGAALEARNPAVGNFFEELTHAFRQEASPADRPLPFCGGWFVLLGYEAARHVEPRVKLPLSPHRFPDALAVRCPAAIIYDRVRDELQLVSEEDESQLAAMQSDVEQARTSPPAAARDRLIDAAEEEPPQLFVDGVRAILDYLGAGDVFQVNLSRAWRARLREGATYADVYQALRASNPAPFAGLATWKGSAIASSSPERLVQVDGDRVQTRPIAGTRARGSTREEDEMQLRNLLANLKERAEHIMLIDLERNDLGRVCQAGSIAVSELMTTETYAHVHHIVSNVTGRLKPGVGPGEVLRAIFPGGTITGCPKVRAMEIIAELERGGRGPYTGAMGYLCRSGRLDMNILIRSLVVEDGGITFRAGAGIVADSDPQAELAETRAKARGLLLALGATP